LASFLGVRWDQPLETPLPLARHTLAPPEPEKWLKDAGELRKVEGLYAPTAERARDVLRHAPEATAPPAATTPAPTAHHDISPLRSVHTSTVATLLELARSSIIVSTYQTGRVVVLRARAGVFNTHFVSLPSPMGIAVAGGRLAIGAQRCVWEFHDLPAVAAKLGPEHHDACFVPRACHLTGDIRVHELAWAGGDMWVVNTRFNSLCTLDGVHSFVPRWRPPFVSALDGNDRCHLNGVAIVDDRPRFVTMLGVSDVAHGWRSGNGAGGCVLDVDSGDIVCANLSMPHSPRWHDGRLWVLESGRGAVVVIDPVSGAPTTVAELPGFTRGLAFLGPYALVGLSQVRESVFDGIPLKEPELERVCGVWMIDTRNGATVGFVRFEEAVQEIFDVQVLHGRVWPEVAEPDADIVASSYVLPEAALADLRGPLVSAAP
jgi:uncharacterized protein (TIGR03032 family)